MIAATENDCDDVTNRQEERKSLFNIYTGNKEKFCNCEKSLMKLHE